MSKKQAKQPSQPAPGPGPGVGGFLFHLQELRKTLVRCIIALVVVAFAAVPFASEIYEIVALPLIGYLPEGSEMIAIGIITPFWVPVKLSLLCAFIVALPYMFYELWRFVAPGLYHKEKRLVVPLIISSYTLFLAGVAFVYFLVFGLVFRFIISIAPESISLMPDIEVYMSFVVTLFILFGIAFEVPVVVFMLSALGIVSHDKLKLARPYVIVGAFVVAAIFTPPDVISQLLLAIPCCILYEIGLLVAPKKPKWQIRQEEENLADEDVQSNEEQQKSSPEKD